MENLDMSSEEENYYNLRSRNKQVGKKLRRKRVRNPVKKPAKSKRTKRSIIGGFTKEGWLKDGFVFEDEDPDYTDNPEYVEAGNYFDLDSKPVQNDIIAQLVENQDIDPEVAESIVRNAFKGTGENLIQSYIGCKPSNERWKLGLSSSIIEEIEPQINHIRDMIEAERPTIPKIIKTNLTETDKVRCVKLYDQLQNIEPFTTAYDQKIEEINNILRKCRNYTKAEIQQLEQIEAQLKTIATPPDNLKNQILTLNAPQHIKGIIYGQYLDMLEHEPGSQTYNAIREEIEWSVRLPHNQTHKSADLSNLSKSELNEYYQQFLDMMDEELYGMQDIKMKMLHIINDRIKSNDRCERNIAIVGPPGTGKTCVGKTMAKVLGVPFEKISVGGLADASIFKGSDRVWNSASPSIILQILSRLKSSNPVVIIDELDKLGETSKGKEVQYALLHISDYIHNKEFRDNFLNKYPHDFSRILFIFCMNSIDKLDSALLNRLDIMETRPYNTSEKMIISQNYVLPKTLRKVNIDSEDVLLTNKAANKLALATRKDPGIRTIEKAVKSLVGKINMYDSILLEDGTTGNIKLGYTIPNFGFPITITPKVLVELTKDVVNY